MIAYYVIKCIDTQGNIYPGEEPIPCTSFENAQAIVIEAHAIGSPWRIAVVL